MAVASSSKVDRWSESVKAWYARHANQETRRRGRISDSSELQFVFPQPGRPLGFEFDAEYCAATITKRVAVGFPRGMVQDVFRVNSDALAFGNSAPHKNRLELTRNRPARDSGDEERRVHNKGIR
jgi:hypothetical protein